MREKTLAGICVVCVAVAISSLSVAVRYSQKAINSELAFRGLALKSVELAHASESVQGNADSFMKIADKKQKIIDALVGSLKISVSATDDIMSAINLQKAFMVSNGVSLTGKDEELFQKLLKSASDKFDQIGNVQAECNTMMVETITY